MGHKGGLVSPGCVTLYVLRLAKSTCRNETNQKTKAMVALWH